MSIAHCLNRLSENERRRVLTNCCAADRWVNGMLGRLPADHDEAVLASAEDVWWSLDRDDWLEAFAAHPMIGEATSLLANYSETKQWAEGEQSGAAEADAVTLRALAEGNLEYKRLFGYIFIVCATGKSAGEMLKILQARLKNSADDEIRIAAAQQLQITQLRLRKLAE